MAHVLLVSIAPTEHFLQQLAQSISGRRHGVAAALRIVPRAPQDNNALKVGFIFSMYMQNYR